MRRGSCTVLWSLALLLAAPAFGASPTRRDPAAMSAADVAACMRANVVDRGALRELSLRAFDRAGSARTVRLKLFWKPPREGEAPRTVLRVEEPADSAGAAVLAITAPSGDEVYLYLPAVGRVERLKSEIDGGLFGTDFTIAELRQIQTLAADAGTRRLADTKVFSRPAFVLDVAGPAAGAGYTRIRSFVDQATCTLLRAEFFRGAGSPAKRLDADVSTLVEVEPWWLMLGYTMEDLRRGTRTELSLSDVFLLERLPDGLFDPETFWQVQP